MILFLLLLTVSTADVTGPLNDFGLQLLKHLPTDENIMISPFSISTAVAMLNAGAGGRTKEQIDTAFGWAGVEGVSGKYGELLESVNSAGGEYFNLSSSNKLYIDNTFTPLQSYSDELTDNFEAEVEAVNFSNGDNSATVKLLNTWVEEETNGKIPDLFSSIESSTRAILINTIYFKASWLKPFDKTTTQETFYLDNKYAVKTETMHVVETLGYYKSDSVQVVKLPYSSGSGDISMLVIKPVSRAGLAQVEKSVDYKMDQIMSWLGQLESTRVKLSMPKFEFKAGVDNLDKIMMAEFGVTDVFDGGMADLDGISDTEDLFVSSIIHRAFISLDPEGTEAAAATAIMVGVTSVMEEPEPIDVKIDQPFLFLIYDAADDVVLFVGRLVAPDVSLLTSKYEEREYSSAGDVVGWTAQVFILALLAFL